MGRLPRRARAKVDWSRCILDGRDLKNADLTGADFTGALVRATDFFRADLSGARWIDGVKICAKGSLEACH